MALTHLVFVPSDREEEALQAYTESQKHAPHYYKSHYNLGRLLILRVARALSVENAEEGGQPVTEEDKEKLNEVLFCCC